MRGQHFAMRVHVDARTRSLFKQLFKVSQIVAADEYRGIFSHAQRNFRDFGVAVCFRVRRVQKCHYVNAEFARLQRQRRQLRRAQRVVQKFGKRRLCERVDFFIRKAKAVRVFHVRRNALETVSYQLPQAPHVFIRRRQYADLLRFRQKVFAFR